MSNFSFENTIYLLKKTQILKVLRNPTFSVAFYSKFASLSDFKKFKFFVKDIYFLLKSHIFKFERSKNSCNSSRILRQFF